MALEDAGHRVTFLCGNEEIAEAEGADNDKIRNHSSDQPLRDTKDSSEKNYQNIAINSSLTHRAGDPEVTASDFDVLSCIGKGGYGKVYLVRKKTRPCLDRLYAMKVVKKARLTIKKDAIHTKSERNILELCAHPFLVKLWYAFQTRGRLYLVLDFVNGGELFSYMEKVNRFEEHVAKFYLAEISLALGHLHESGIIYRDLKPENVLLDKEGHCKLTDFGLSKEKLNTLSITNTYCGTYEYMAPEIMRRCGHGMCVDWWSLGVLALDMISGSNPFGNYKRELIQFRILNGIYDIPPNITKNFKLFISQLLTVDPVKRLGAHPADVAAIKGHAFYLDTDWTALLEKRIKPPIEIELQSEEDVSMFDQEAVRLQPGISPDVGHQVIMGGGAAATPLDDFFADFHFVSHHAYDEPMSTTSRSRNASGVSQHHAGGAASPTLSCSPSGGNLGGSTNGNCSAAAVTSQLESTFLFDADFDDEN